MTLAGATALVTGATGFLGGDIVRRLAAEGARVRALARRPGRDVYIRDVPNVEIVMGDITDAARMNELAAGCDYVLHCAAATGGSMTYQRRLNVDGTRSVMQAAAAARVRRVVHVSTIAVYGYGYTGDVTEDMPQKPGRVPYNVTKSEAEKVVREVGADNSLPYSIIRPGMIYGPRSGMWTMFMFNLGKRSPTIFLGDGSGYVHPIYIDDVVDMAVLLLTHPAAAGEAFNCAPDPAPTWREFLGGYSALAGHQNWRGLPALPFRIIAPLAELALTLRGEPQDVPALIPFLQGRKTYKMDKACRLLGWEARVSLDDGIRRCEPWLREKGLLP
ncbi:MAG: NAD(P)-dependent oxidoreductase [Chloroflexi bacterium]|nr:NAD(P)-dependent oxidoreductase [Chloroflexota bacterium]